MNRRTISLGHIFGIPIGLLRSQLKERNEKVRNRYSYIEEELSRMIRKGESD